jgi:hypothetical protein
VVQGILGPFGETLTHESFSVAINEAIERVRAEYKEELRQLRLSLRLQTTEINEIKEDNEVLRCQALATSNMRMTGTTGAGAQSSSSLKIAKPSEFTGDKDSIDVDTFHLQCDLYISQYPSVSEQQKNSFMLSFCK